VILESPDKLEPLFKTKKRFIAIEGGRCSGKSWGVAMATVLKGSQGLPCVCCRDIASSMDKSIYTLIGDTIERMGIIGWRDKQREFTHSSGGSIYTMGLKGGSKLETRTRIKGLEGIMWAWLEEAESATEEVLNIYKRTIRKTGSQQIYTYNRYLDSDPVHRMFVSNINKKTTEHIHIDYDENPFCPKEEYEEAERLKDNDNDFWLHIYKGEPMAQASQAILSRVKVMAAMGRKPDKEGGIEIGADIARYGDDMTVFFKRKGLTVIDVKEYKKQSIPETARQLMAFASQHTNPFTIPIKIDDSGLGGGVTDILRENKYKAIPINNGQCAKNKDKYPNAISEQWFELAKQIDKIVLPSNDRLKMELTSRFFKIDSKSKRCIESKDDYKKRGFKSPDYADACLLCFYNRQSGTFEDIAKEDKAGTITQGFRDKQF